MTGRRLIQQMAILAALVLGVGLMQESTWAEDETAVEEEEEPELTREEQKRHNAEVKKIVKDLKSAKNQELALARIKSLGAKGTRVARDALILYAKGNKNHSFVTTAFKGIASIGGKVAIEFLCGKDALRSKSFLVQYGAVEALEVAKDRRATGPLLDVLTNKRTKIKVISAAAPALARTAGDDERVIEELLKLTRHRKDTIRAYALDAIGYLATDEAMARLQEALFEDKNARCREYAATGMENSKRSDMVPHLRRALKSDNSLSVQQACMTAIRKLGG